MLERVDAEGGVHPAPFPGSQQKSLASCYGVAERIASTRQRVRGLRHTAGGRTHFHHDAQERRRGDGA
jgi:hypothetical protein